MQCDTTTRMQLSEAISRFISYIEIDCNPSPRTLINYNHYLKKFLLWAGDRLVNDLIMDDVEKYRFFLYAQKKPNGEKRLGVVSLNHHMVALRILFRYCIAHGVKAPMPEGIKAAKVPDRKVEFLTREEVFKLIDAINGRGIRAFRNKAVIAMLFSTGLRIAELVSLNKEDVDLSRREFAVVGKGRKLRLVFLNEFSVQTLQNYLERRNDQFPALFVNYKSYRINKDNPNKRRMHAASIQRMISGIAKKAGIQKHVTPHVLRHSFGTELMIKGADIRAIQELMGHASVNTTMIYTHVTNSRLREIHNRILN